MGAKFNEVVNLYLGCEMLIESTGERYFLKPSNMANNWQSKHSSYAGKPILRPLSDLIKEENGEAPIVTLKNFEATAFLKYVDSEKLIAQQKIIDINVFSSDEGNEYTVKYLEPYTNMDDGILTFSYCDKFKRFGKIMLQPMRKPLSVGGQLQMFQKMLEWRFDLFGLIESGEAIDKNKITSNGKI